MEKISVTSEKYKCSYCGYIHRDGHWMRNRELDHKKVDDLEIGSIVIYNFVSGNIRKGTVIRKDVAHNKFLVEADNGERDWTSFYINGVCK